jgi:membrane protein DedA with SNARE-associated domain
MAIDAVLPAASEVVMMYAGAVASGAFASQDVVFFGNEIDRGFDAYVAVALAGTIGYTVGSIGGWAIGRWGGRRYLERHGRWLHLDGERLERAERWFERWEDWAVFLGRLTPVVRSFVSIPAGVLEARFVRYVVLTLLGSAIWCFAFAGGGWAAGANWEEIHHASRYFDYLIVIAIVAIGVWLVLRRRSKRRLAEESASR